MSNWAPLTRDGVANWALLEPATGNVVGPQAGVLRLVGQTPTVVGLDGTIDGGGEITPIVESNFTAFWDVLGYVEADLTITYQIKPEISPAAGTIRLVGQALTLAFNWNRTPSVGTVRLAGQTPTVEVTGDKTVSPSVGALRFAGNIPFLLPTYSYPSAGTLRFAGTSPEITRFGYPTSGTLRFEGRGTWGIDLSPVWQVFDTYVEADFSPFWQRTASVTSDLTVSWEAYG